MEDDDETVSISVIWRGKKLNVEVNSSITLKEFGQSLQNLTNVKSDTIRLLVPKSHHNISKMLYPFSEEHSSLSLQECCLLEGKSITMMGVFKDEIEEVSQNISKADMRIAGFEEEERRLRQRMLNTTHNLLKLPQGSYIFCDFRTLHLPGIELNPPASEALRRMHMLAADPGIVAIMNKHRWRVGIMTEMAPVGYVGVSPKCILGFNKNHGEEISLRLRTDDLKGFRKYESIKKTLLHELAHMVYSEHDDDFKNLDSQLNQEAANLDWTKSRGHTLNGLRSSISYEEELDVETAAAITSHKLGGERSDQLATARAASVAAAYRRLADVSTNSLEGQQGHAEPDPDDYEPDPDDSILNENMQIGSPREVGTNPNYVLNRNSDFRTQNDHNDFVGGESMEVEPCLSINGNQLTYEPDPDDGDMAQPIPRLRTDVPKVCAEPDPDECEHDRDECQTLEGASNGRVAEPDPDDSLANGKVDEEADLKKFSEPDPDDSQATESGEFTATKVNKTREEPDPDDSSVKRANLEHKTNVIPNPGDSLGNRLVHDEPDSDDKENFSGESLSWDEELLRIQDPVAVFCNRLEKTISMLKSEVSPMDATSVLQTLFKIIKNVIEHPGETRFKRLRKANPQFQRSVAKYKAAMEVLNLVGFIEDIVSDEIGRSETYMVLKRNDPGLLWLAKSSLETCIAC